MSSGLGVWNVAGDPAGGGTQADIGQKAYDVLTGLTHVKIGEAETAWALASTIFSGGIFSGVALQAFTTAGAGTYTPNALMKYCLVISTGAGGGGGGADTDGSAGSVGCGAGGGAGGTCIEAFSASQVGASQDVSVGAGGAGGSNTGGNGVAGGATTFGTAPLHTANGGGAGGGSGTSTTTTSGEVGGNGGTGSNGTVNITGGDGSDGAAFSVDGTTDISYGVGGFGGVSFWGGGGDTIQTADATLTSNSGLPGNTGKAKGSGGSGAIVLSSTTGQTGGTGADGIIVVIEFLGAA